MNRVSKQNYTLSLSIHQKWIVLFEIENLPQGDEFAMTETKVDFVRTIEPSFANFIKKFVRHLYWGDMCEVITIEPSCRQRSIRLYWMIQRTYVVSKFPRYYATVTAQLFFLGSLIKRFWIMWNSMKPKSEETNEKKVLNA